jgi:hypothetical protein
MERQIDNEKWEIVQRLEKRFYTYTIRKDRSYKIKDKDIRIIMTECLEKPERKEYFVFVNGTLIHCQDALQVLDGLDIQDKPEIVDYTPDYNVEDLF